MLNILFWNLKRNSIEEYIAKCIIENNVTIAAFSEYEGIDFIKLEMLLANQYYFVKPVRKDIKIKVIILIKTSLTVSIAREEKRYSIYNVDTVLNHYILAVVHLEDRRNNNTHDRMDTIKKLIQHIEEKEKTFECKNTIIIGDFNANPYDEELLSIFAFNSVLFKSIIKKSEIRKRNLESYKRFYNPILNYISENNEMYGSFYCNTDTSTPYWHCLDQILLRKDLIDFLCDLRYIKRIDDANLIKDLAPNSEISDHLPLFVKLAEVEQDV